MLVEFTALKIVINANISAVKNHFKFQRLVKKLIKLDKKQAKFNNAKNTINHDNGTYFF